LPRPRAFALAFFVRRSICSVRGDLSPYALLGRFLPRLGPLGRAASFFLGSVCGLAAGVGPAPSGPCQTKSGPIEGRKRLPDVSALSVACVLRVHVRHVMGQAGRALSRCHAKSASGRRHTDFQAAATTSRHVLIATVRSLRCVWAELRWRWTLKVLKTAACVDRNFCEDPALLKRCILRSRRRVGDANSRPDCFSIARAHASVRCRDRSAALSCCARRLSPSSCLSPGPPTRSSAEFFSRLLVGSLSRCAAASTTRVIRNRVASIRSGQRAGRPRRSRHVAACPSNQRPSGRQRRRTRCGRPQRWHLPSAWSKRTWLLSSRQCGG
jgi:hypothetical protein